MTEAERRVMGNRLAAWVAGFLVLALALPWAASPAFAQQGPKFPPLTGRVTPALPYSSDFSQAQTHQRLCWGGVDYIYAGSREMSFNDALLDAQPAWYTAALTLPNARIVQVHGCGE